MRFRTSYAKALNYLIIITGMFLLVISYTSGDYWVMLIIIICAIPYMITYTIENEMLLIQAVLFKKQ